VWVLGAEDYVYEQGSGQATGDWTREMTYALQRDIVSEWTQVGKA